MFGVLNARLSLLFGAQAAWFCLGTNRGLPAVSLCFIRHGVIGLDEGLYQRRSIHEGYSIK